jgi:glucosylceramidase
MTTKHLRSKIALTSLAALLACSKAADSDSSSDASTLEFWLTNPDKSSLFRKQNTSQSVNATGNVAVINVDEAQQFQSMEGFGCALTGGSAMLIHLMNTPDQDALLTELFATDGNNIGISYLRISIGSSDLDDHVFSYDDLGAGQTDTALTRFSLDPDRLHLIPVLKKIVAMNPSMKFLGSPWSAPTWMKTNGSSIGGSLKPQYYDVYARYFVKYIQAMKAEGIRIDAITVQNEPLYGGNNPSMMMQASEQALFIKAYLGPAFAAAGIDTKIIIYDHNADRTDYPITVLNDAQARKYVDGSAFHLYGGSISDLSNVHDAHPDKNIYFTEQWVGAPGNFASDVGWHTKTLVIGGSLNWCRNVLEWNLASDPNQDPHTPGGCSQCLGAVTIAGSTVIRNPAYYIMAHAAKFVRPGSLRISSTWLATLPNVAFRTSTGKKVLIVFNDTPSTQIFKINSAGTTFTTLLAGGAVGTYVW